MKLKTLEDKTTSLQCKVDPELIRKAKVLGACADMSLAEVVTEALTDYVDSVLPARIEGLGVKRVASGKGAA